MCSGLYAQEIGEFGQVPINNYSGSDYNAGIQNWGIAQDKNGTMYFANQDGLLSFNGNVWKLYPLPNQTTVRAVATDNSGKIFVGSFEEFGYFEPDKYGKLNYTSLSEKINNYNFHNEEIWKIIVTDESIYFQSFMVVFRFNKQKIEVIDPKGFITSFNYVNDQILASIKDNGLYRLVEDSFIQISKEPFFQDTEISNILPWENKSYLLTTTRDGIYVLSNDNKINTWKSEAAENFRSDQINRGLISPEGKVIIGTILNGIYILNRNGEIHRHINKGNGLQNNTVLYLYYDNDGDLWAGLDRGIDLLKLNADVTFFSDIAGKLGSVYAINTSPKHLYIGTNQGIYRANLPKNKSRPYTPDFKLIPKSQGQVWNICNTHGQLLFGHNTGTFSIMNDVLELISGISGAFSFEIFSHQGKEYLIGSTYTLLVVFEKKDGRWVFRNTVSDFMHPIKEIKIDYLGNIWASHFVKGLFKLKLNDSLNRVENIAYYGKAKGFNSDYKIQATRLNDRIVFINQGNLYIYNDLLDSAIQFHILGENLKNLSGIKYITRGNANHSWLIAENGIFNIKQTGEKFHVARQFPIELFRKKAISGQEHMFILRNGDAILAMDNGLAYLKSDSTALKQGINIKPFFTGIFSWNEAETHYPIAQKGQNDFPSIPFRNNSLTFQFAYPTYQANVYFLIKLEGLENKWNKTGRGEYKYDRIPPGKYNLILKAVKANGAISDTVSWSFEIRSPWYLSLAAKVLYGMLFLAILGYIRLYYKRRLKSQARRMHIEKERELIRLRNEKLESEIKFKTEELANTTLSIIKKNELLFEIRKMLMQQRRNSSSGQMPKFGSMVKLLDRNISNEDDWKIFEHNFEQAHLDFLKRIKEKIPDLTPGDLKLCAYLRMNLSSKKIALLLGISIRGVENHRYRLRKKIGLEHDSNLIEYMMKF
jgi:ligand-binding sensor domain-containing protein/DNA-binding CsgD family transcriptional regulator